MVIQKTICNFALLKRNSVITFLILMLILYLLFNLTEGVSQQPQLFSKKKLLKYLVVSKKVCTFASSMNDKQKNRLRILNF